METSLVSTLPLICVFAALIYAAFVGEKTYSSTGAVSILGVAITLFGLIVGWLLERFLPFPHSLDDLVNDRSTRLEVPMLFFCVTAITLLAVTMAKKDAIERPKAASGSRRLALLIPLFVFAVGLAARVKIAAFLAVLFVNVNP
jgi:fucose 4-O-acetylase-like acetyltransferase